MFYNLTTNEAVATTRDAKALDKASEKIAEVADQIRAEDFPAKPGSCAATAITGRCARRTSS